MSFGSFERVGSSDRSLTERLERSERLVRIPDSEANESLHLNVFAGLCRGLRDQLADGDVGVTDRRLVDEHELRVEAPQLPLDDLVEHVRRLAGVFHLRAVDRL